MIDPDQARVVFLAGQLHPADCSVFLRAFGTQIAFVLALQEVTAGYERQSVGEGPTGIASEWTCRQVARPAGACPPDATDAMRSAHVVRKRRSGAGPDESIDSQNESNGVKAASKYRGSDDSNE
jgi:hypothetical protein